MTSSQIFVIIFLFGGAIAGGIFLMGLGISLMGLRPYFRGKNMEK